MRVAECLKHDRLIEALDQADVFAHVVGPQCRNALASCNVTDNDDHGAILLSLIELLTKPIEHASLLILFEKQIKIERIGPLRIKRNDAQSFANWRDVVAAGFERAQRRWRQERFPHFSKLRNQLKRAVQHLAESYSVEEPRELVVMISVLWQQVELIDGETIVISRAWEDLCG
jgi:hypothetical protein